jgi:hypothetical protein
VVTWLGTRGRSDDTAQAWRGLASRLAGASLLLLAPYLSQDVFYNGTLPTGTRYNFPALLAWPIWLAVAMESVRRFFERSGSPGLARASWHGSWILFLAVLV